MKILFLGGFSFREGGGVGRVSRSLASEFIRQGHGCCFLATTPGKDEIIGKVHQFFVPSKRIESRQNQRYLKHLLRNRKIDVIINQTGFSHKAFGLLESALGDCVVLTAHHNCVACLHELHESIISQTLSRYKVPLWARPKWAMRLLKARSRRKTARCIERISLKGDGIVLLADSFIGELSVFTERINLGSVFAIPNPCPFSPDPTALAEKGKSVLYVGRLENGQKRIDRLFEIWLRLSKQNPDWRLDVVGDGADAKELKKNAEKLKLKRVTFHGKQDPMPFYREATLLLLPSDFEGFGMVLVEAQAFGCIPVASNCFSGIKSIILDGRSGFIVQKADIIQYCERASSLMNGSNGLHQLQTSALEQVAQFQPETICREWLRCIETVSLNKGTSLTA